MTTATATGDSGHVDRARSEDEIADEADQIKEGREEDRISDHREDEREMRDMPISLRPAAVYRC